MIIRLPIIHEVPCGKCTACCQGDAIFMHPENGDDTTKYDTETYEGRLILKHKPNGDCIYLDRAKGCTIWERRPCVCKELDCRRLLGRIGEKQMKALGLGKVVTAAKELMNRLAREHAAKEPL